MMMSVVSGILSNKISILKFLLFAFSSVNMHMEGISFCYGSNEVAMVLPASRSAFDFFLYATPCSL